ncbi:MAG TPA: choice-of-anchor Q domain-containing protein [Acidobacteriaceae bacterium]|nr:choice-of-anchor Q domain-containing protein [Acidobacteriaceae bacterium]
MRKSIGRNWMKVVGLLVVSGGAILAAGCSSTAGGGTTPPPPITYSLTVASANPATGVAITASPADASGTASGTTGFSLTYAAGSTVTLTASATAGGDKFSSWSGCTTTSTVTCSVTMSGNTTVTASYSSAKTYYVSGTGSDSADGLTPQTAFLTLQHAADVTQPGDTVYAMNGTYTNTCSSCDVVDINTAGTANAWITFEAYPGQTPVVSFNGWAGFFVHYTAAYIQISGFTVVGNNYNVTLAQAQQQSTTNPDPAFNGNCIVSDGREGTATQKPHHLKFLNNTIYACAGAGIGTAQSDYLTIAGNTIYDSAWYTIYDGSAISTYQDWNYDNTTGYKIFITGNRIFGNQNLIPDLDSGTITDGEAIIVDTNRNSTYDPTIGIPAYVGRTLIDNNVIYGNGSAAIEAFESDHVDVVNNSSYNDVLNSNVSGRGEMNLNEASDVNVINNIFYASAGQNPAVVCCNASQVLLDYNVYSGGTNYSGMTAGPHDLTGNPLYVDPADANRMNVLLTLSPSSPALGSGTSYLAPATDFLGNPRPGSDGYDRGAYQQP